MINAGEAGTFRIGGEIEINRIGFGAMRIAGPGIWGEPENRAEVLQTLNQLRRLASISWTLPIPMGRMFRRS
jgi:pyridoxine 4-dehydrogenase